MRARNFNELRARVLIILVEISEKETKEQRYVFHKQLLNLFQQPMLMIHQRLFVE